jgi:hypothetical protein
MAFIAKAKNKKVLKRGPFWALLVAIVAKVAQMQWGWQ